MDYNKNWLSRAKNEANKGIPRKDRIVSIVIFFISLLMLFFFVAHKVFSIGFYTSDFDLLEMIALYGFFLVWIITAFLEGVLGQRFASRVFDVFGGIIFAALSLAWLSLVFPFEFAYFADVLPDFLRFLVGWISNDIARVIMILLTILHFVAAVYSPIAYKFIKVDFRKNGKIKILAAFSCFLTAFYQMLKYA